MLSTAPQSFRTFFSKPGLRYIGRISYGIYIYHMIIFTLMHEWFRPWLVTYLHSMPMTLVIKWILSVPLVLLTATFSWFGLEKPMLALKDRFRARARSTETRREGVLST
jgi:peptidoglycan/LPS O-acetylase OafA/YrhL